MSAIKQIINGFKKDTIYLAVALILLGLVLVVFPEKSTLIICYSVGILLLVGGVFKIVSYFRAKGTEIFGSLGLVGGSLLCVAGLIIVLKPQMLASFLTTILAIILIADGVVKVQYAIDLYRVEGDRWWMVLTAGIVMTILGIIALFNPFDTAAAIMIIIGILLIIDGITDLIMLVYVAKTLKIFNDALLSEDALNVEAVPVDNGEEPNTYKTEVVDE